MSSYPLSISVATACCLVGRMSPPSLLISVQPGIRLGFWVCVRLNFNAFQRCCSRCLFGGEPPTFDPLQLRCDCTRYRRGCRFARCVDFFTPVLLKVFKLARRIAAAISSPCGGGVISQPFESLDISEVTTSPEAVLGPLSRQLVDLGLWVVVLGLLGDTAHE